MKKIGRYEIVRELGRGGMASVVLANDPRFGREVAVKILPAQFTHDDGLRARFKREAQTIARLEHPAIAPVYDFGEENNQPFIVMRYMPGGSLADRMRGGLLSTEAALDVFDRIADALDSAHDAGVIHRDLKPGNILFDQYDNAYLSDFGIAKLAQSVADFTNTGGVIGTPTYMSPEQGRGDKGIDRRSDVYALGANLFHVLTGLPPFQAETPIGLVMKHITEPLPTVRTLRPDLGVAVDQVLQRAMAKDPDERYPTASRVIDDLRRVLNGDAAAGARADATVITGAGAAENSAELTSPTTRKLPWLWIGLAAAALLTIGLIATVMVSGLGDSPDDASSSLTIATPTTALSAAADATDVGATEPPDPTETPTPVPTEIEATAVPTRDPALPSAVITSIVEDGDALSVEYATLLLTSGQQVHFYFDTVEEADAGVPGRGPWTVYAGESPFEGWESADIPADADQICVIVANDDQTIDVGSGDCVDLP